MKAGLIALTLLGTASPRRPTVTQDKPVVAIIGTGTLAGTLGPVVGAHGYRVIYGSRDPARESVQALVKRTGSRASAVGQREAAAQAQIILLAVPGEVVEEVAANLGELEGKIIIDVSGGDKRVAPDGYLELVSDSTHAERVQARHPRMRVVRINLPNMALFLDPLLLGTRATVPVAGNDPRAREAVAVIMFDLRVLGTLFDRRTRFARELLVAMQARFGESMFDTVIRTSVRLREAAAHGVPVQVLDPRSSAAGDFAALAQEVERVPLVLGRELCSSGRLIPAPRRNRAPRPIPVPATSAAAVPAPASVPAPHLP